MQKNVTLYGKANNTTMHKVIVFTDIHFNASQRVKEINPALRLSNGLAHVAKYNADADRVLITGDLTDNGDVESYQLLKSTLEKYNLPIELMIGNHDNRENFEAVFPTCNKNENAHIQWVEDIEDYSLIHLDTLFAPPYDYPRSHAGYLCEERLSWLEYQLAKRQAKRCIIFMHHPPHDVGFKAMDTIKLINGDAFYSVIEKFGNVKHIVCGHIHRTIFGIYNDIPFSIFKSTVGQMPMLFETMDFKVETHEPAAYGILNLGKNGITIHTEDFELTDLEAYQN